LCTGLRTSTTIQQSICSLVMQVLEFEFRGFHIWTHRLDKFMVAAIVQSLNRHHPLLEDVMMFL